MKALSYPSPWCLTILLLSFPIATRASEPPPPPDLTELIATNGQQVLKWSPHPAAEQYRVLATTNLNNTPTEVTTGTINGNTFTSTNSAPAAFYRLQVVPLSSNALLTATVLNRLAYGQTPDELQRVTSIGPQAFINEQLAPWILAEDADTADAAIAAIGARLAAADEPVTTNHANLTDFRAWHVLRAVNARRQLLEILLQFWENHFVTEYGKGYTWINGNFSGDLRRRLAAKFEYTENSLWRAALLNPQCTFYDLLKVSAESPAMIVYLDTVTSRGDGTRVANENYARELLELFCCGVENGYDQDNIVVMSRGWTGWRVEFVETNDAFNPFALQATTLLDTNGPPVVTNFFGVYAFNYKQNFHNNSVKTVFPGKTVPGRFGPPWAGASYEQVLNNGSGTNSIQDGYQIIQHLANLPFTEEYISVKLCRLLVHDNFPNPTTDTNLPEYAYYDYTRTDLTPEAELVHACMMAWETNSPRGQIWRVVQTIVDSDLFRSHTGSLNKIKTPLEFTVSAIRALRSSTNGSGLDGTFTSDTDGFAISGTSQSNVDAPSPLNRMGTMLLFDRESPDGYPEDGSAWISAGTLAERIRWVQSLCIAAGQTGHKGSQNGTGNDAGESWCDPVLLLRSKLPSSSWGNAGDVAGYFASLLFPAEGAANLDLYRQSAEDFLNTADSGAPSPFDTLSYSNSPGSTYDTRVRGMVALLLSFQRFHEQ